MNDSITQQLIEIINELKPGLEIPQNQLVEAGYIDSFDIIVLVDAIEEKFGISLPGSSITPENFNSVSSLISLIEESLNSK